MELEKDLSVKRQFVDVIIIEQQTGDPPEDLPDGLDNLAPHNLLTYKSLADTHYCVESDPSDTEKRIVGSVQWNSGKGAIWGVPIPVAHPGS